MTIGQSRGLWRLSIQLTLISCHNIRGGVIGGVQDEMGGRLIHRQHHHQHTDLETRPFNLWSKPPRALIHPRITYTHTPIYAYTHTSMHPYIYAPTYLYTCPPMHPYTHTPMHSYTHTPIRPHTHTPIHPYVHALIHPSAHTPTHPCTHTPQAALNMMTRTSAAGYKAASIYMNSVVHGCVGV